MNRPAFEEALTLILADPTIRALVNVISDGLSLGSDPPVCLTSMSVTQLGRFLSWSTMLNLAPTVERVQMIISRDSPSVISMVADAEPL